MSQIFSRAADSWIRLFLIAIVVSVVAIFTTLAGFVRSDYVTRVGWAPDQPIPFSHEHHVSGLGIDCRYCHTGVEVTANAGFPSTHTCMTCHSQIWTNAEMLEPLRRSLADGTPIHWRRVAKLPDYVYFRHDAHIRAGVACQTCHGHIERMKLTMRAEPFQMGWCLDCHRHPAPELRRDVAETDITHCALCHR